MIKQLIEQLVELKEEDRMVYVIIDDNVVKAVVRSVSTFYNSENSPSLSCWTDNNIKITGHTDIYETEDEAYGVLKTQIENKKQEIDEKLVSVTFKVEEISRAAVLLKEEPVKEQ